MPGPPIRKPSDHSPPAGSPRNIAGHHVLHRPLMPRHPPNAQKNKQQNTRQNQETCRRNLTVRCSRPLYSSQPTHPHPPKNPHNQEPQTSQATRAHCPRTPTACHPHTPKARGGTHHHPTGQQRACLSCQHQTNQPPARTNPRDTVNCPALPQGQTPSRPRPIQQSEQDQNSREATPHNQSLERR